MKATKYLSLAALALMGTLASCQSDDDFTVARPANAVGINVSVGSLQTTRTNPASADPDEAHLFNLDDQVCVSTDGQDPVLFQCQNADQQTWAEAVSGKFLLWKQSEMTFQAYYPATTGTSMTTFTVPTDQSSVEKIALADYMTRQQVISRPEGGSDIQMQLERKMARVIVRIAGFNDQYFNNQKTVSNVRIYSEASGIASGNPTGSSTEIQPYAQGNGGQGSTYTALVVPGYGDSGARFIKLTDGEYNTLLVKGIPELEAGNSYTFNLVVGKNRILVQSVTVQDWATGTTLAGGQATELTAPAIPFSKQSWMGNPETGEIETPANFVSVSQTDAKAAADAEKTKVNAPGYVCIYALEGGQYKWIDSHGRTGQNSNLLDLANGDAWEEVYECHNAGDNNSIWFTVSQ